MGNSLLCCRPRCVRVSAHRARGDVATGLQLRVAGVTVNHNPLQVKLEREMRTEGEALKPGTFHRLRQALPAGGTAPRCPPGLTRSRCLP